MDSRQVTDHQPQYLPATSPTNHSSLCAVSPKTMAFSIWIPIYRRSPTTSDEVMTSRPREISQSGANDHQDPTPMISSGLGI